MSGGQQQMVAIARALSADPVVLMLDEPTAGLAPLIIATITQALGDVRRAGLTLLIVEQTMAIAGPLADRFLFMEDGRIVAEANRAMIAAVPDLRARYLGVKMGAGSGRLSTPHGRHRPSPPGCRGRTIRRESPG